MTTDSGRDWGIDRRGVLKGAAMAGAFGTIGIGALTRPARAAAGPIMYGTGLDKKIYEIDPAGSTTELFTSGLSPSVNLNGNAFDAVTGRFYYSEFDGSGTQSDLYFVDVTSPTETFAGTLAGGAASGTISLFDGHYYYVENGTDDLKRVTFDAAGAIASESFVGDITGDANQLGFGDIAFETATQLYFSAVKNDQGNAPIAGVIDISGPSPVVTEWNTGQSSWTNNGVTGALQLALTEDGTLYGQNAGDGQFYTVDKATGALTQAFSTSPTRFADLAGNWVVEDCEPTTLELCAGQDEVVGTVSVVDDGDSLTVTYDMDPDAGWLLYETHVDIGDEPGDLATNRGGNPQVGRFDLSDSHDGVTSYSYTVDCGDEALADVAGGADTLFIAAHAVVSKPTVFGVERVTGDLYELDVAAGTASLVADITDPAPGNINSPNGLAYDASTGRLYYSASEDTVDASATSELYFWDGSSSTLAGAVDGMLLAGATFHDGEYYFVANATDDLKKITFLADGTIDTSVGSSGVTDVCLDFTGGTDSFRFGDIVIDPETGTLYGSSLRSGSTSTPPTFFKIEDLGGDCTYTEITTAPGDAVGLQLAYGSNGALYAHATGSGETYAVDPTDGSITPVNTILVDGHGFTDLASGDPIDESAWVCADQDGVAGFDGRSWATYFEYAACAPFDACGGP